MPISDQFTGLDMKNLIGAPLSASADASVQLAQSTAEFINTVGFDQDGNTRSTNFKFNKTTINDDGTKNDEEMNVEVPLLSIVPIPNLQIDEVNVLFDMEVKQTEKSESSKDFGGSTSISAGFFGVKATVTGSVSSHSSNTRSTDNSAKYHVDVRATNHGTPEGLARVLDMMAANVAPALVSSTALDETGNALTGDRKARNDQLKKLKAEKEQCNIAASAAQKSFDDALAQFKRLGQGMQNKYSVTLTSLLNAAEESTDTKTLTENQEKINQQWQTFQVQAKDYLDMASTAAGSDAPDLKTYFVLGGVDDKGAYFDYKTASENNDVTTMNTSFKNAVDADKKYQTMVERSSAASKAYNDLLCDSTAPALPEPKA